MKKIISIFLSITLLASFDHCLSFFVEATEEINYNEIYTLSDLIKVKDALYENYILMADIVIPDFEYEEGGQLESYWTPIGENASNAYAGTFNGNNHSIKNIKIRNLNNDGFYYGFFGYISNATIFDLSIDIEIIIDTIPNFASWNFIHCGGLTGYASKSNIYNCKSSNDIDLKYNYLGDYIAVGSYIGGLVGYLTGEIDNCISNGKVSVNSYTKNSSSNYVGGIAGYLVGTVSNSKNNTYLNVDYTSNGTGSVYIGGIAGRIIGTQNMGSQYKPYESYNCVNNGNISCITSHKSNSYNYIGGIFGNAIYRVLIRNMDNYGNIESNYKSNLKITSYEGGIVGFLGDTMVYGYDLTISRCANTGELICNILSQTTDKSYLNIGGITGLSKGFSNISYSKNAASIECNYNIDNKFNGECALGGISGQSESIQSSKIANDNYNKGNFYSNADGAYVGGLFGVMCFSNEHTISNFYNIGNINSKESISTYFGNVIGKAESKASSAIVNMDGIYFMDNGNEPIDEICGSGRSIVNYMQCQELSIKDRRTFEKFDFDEIWCIQDSINEGYPEIRNCGYFEKIDISMAKIIYDDMYVYTGNEIIPFIEVVVDDKVLLEKEDYTVSCYNNIDGGIASFVVSGLNNYYGTVKKQFFIYCPVSGVQLNASFVTLNINQSFELKASVIPTFSSNKVLIWKSDNPSVVTVDNGRITGVAEGSALVSVTSEDGNKTAYCTVYVNVEHSENHKYNENLVTMPTCTKDGISIFVCSCGEWYKENVPAIGHSFTNYIYNNDATTENDGTKTAKCDRCDATDTIVAEGTKQPSTQDNINSLAKSKINVAPAKTIDYKSYVTIKATATGVPEGYYLAIYVNGKHVAKGTNTEVTYNAGQITSDINYTVKVIDANGNVQKDANGNELSKDSKVVCNAGFFKKLIAFFKGLFGSLPTVTISLK